MPWTVAPCPPLPARRLSLADRESSGREGATPGSCIRRRCQTRSSSSASELEAGADDFLAKPPVTAELEARSFASRGSCATPMSLIQLNPWSSALGLAIEARDPCTRGHCQRLAAGGTALGTRHGLGDDRLVTYELREFLELTMSAGVQYQHRLQDAV